MIEKPFFISDAQIITILLESYGLGIKTLQFFPFGEASWTYKAIDVREHIWFVKIWRHKLRPSSIIVPEFLRDKLGYRFVLAPLSNKYGLLWQSIVEHELVVYPYLLGKTVMDDAAFNRWQEIGYMFALLHSTVLPSDIRRMLQSEDFIPIWGDTARNVIANATNTSSSGTSYELAKLVQIKEQEMQTILARTEELGSLLRQEEPELVFCHADPNQSNIFITDDNEIVLIDWDDVMIAPRERDLMFFTGKEQKRFMSGYDKVRKYSINPLAVAYYKYEWVVQEIGSYGSQIFFSDADDRTKQHALQEFYKLFANGDVVQEAYAADLSI